MVAQFKIDWDVEEILADDVCKAADIVLSNLPEDISATKIVPEPLGRIRFEWRNRENMFAISIGCGTIVYYSIEIEGKKNCKIIRFDQTIDTIKKMLKKL